MASHALVTPRGATTGVTSRRPSGMRAIWASASVRALFMVASASKTCPAHAPKPTGSLSAHAGHSLTLSSWARLKRWTATRSASSAYVGLPRIVPTLRAISALRSELATRDQHLVGHIDGLLRCRHASRLAGRVERTAQTHAHDVIPELQLGVGRGGRLERFEPLHDGHHGHFRGQRERAHVVIAHEPLRTLAVCSAEVPRLRRRACFASSRPCTAWRELARPRPSFRRAESRLWERERAHAPSSASLRTPLHCVLPRYRRSRRA